MCSVFGYKEVVNNWEVENLDTDSLMRYFTSLSAKFFIKNISKNQHHKYFIII